MVLRRALYSVLVLAGGCGRIGFDDRSPAPGDAGADAPACNVGPWGALVPQSDLATNLNDWEPALHKDGLVLVFARQTSTNSDLYVATRTSLSGSFTSPHLIPAASSLDFEYGPAWSPDGKRLYFRFDAMPSTTEVRVLDYLGGTSFSSIFQQADLPASSFSWEFTPDDLEVFYTTARVADDYDLEHAKRASTSSPWVVDNVVDGLQRTGVGMDEGWPAFDAARQTLYFERDGALSTSTRSAPGEAFGPPMPAPGIVPDMDGDPDLSDDGLTLVFSSKRNGGTSQNELFLTTRSCL